jgi:transcriptional regulator with XRE-family HTH domain
MTARTSKLGTFLHDARVKAGLSQKDVADKFGYKSAQVISDWERGLRSPPSTVLKKLVELYDVPMETFFELILEERTAILEQKLRKNLGVKRRASGR